MYQLKDVAPCSAQPMIIEPEDGARLTPKDIQQWLIDHQAMIMAHLDESGAVLVRGLSQLTRAADFSAAAQVMAGDFMSYRGGTSPRALIGSNVYEATRLPDTWSLLLHQEMSYLTESPSRITFFAEKPARLGGETLIGDMRAVTANLPEDLKGRFRQRGLRLQRLLLSQDHPQLQKQVQKTWQEVFMCDSRQACEKIAREKSWDIEWIDEGAMILAQDILPALRQNPRTGEETWFNQCHIFSPFGQVQWALRDNRIAFAEELVKKMRTHPHYIDQMVYGDGRAIDEADVLTIFRIMEEHEFHIALQQSDILLLDNYRVAHGRKAFRGARQILVTLHK